MTALPSSTATATVGLHHSRGLYCVSTNEQDLTAQRTGLDALGVPTDRTYVDHGLTGTTRARPGLREALAACRSGDTLVVTKLDRLARSVPDARDIVAELIASGVCLQLGASVHDPTDPVGRLLFNVLAMVAEFEADLIRARTREGMAVAKAKGRLRGKQPKLTPRQEAHLVSLARVGEHHARTGRALQRWPLHHLPGYPARRRSRFHCGHRALSPARGNPLGPPRAARPAPPPSVDRTPPHSDRSHTPSARRGGVVQKRPLSHSLAASEGRAIPNEIIGGFV